MAEQLELEKARPKNQLSLAERVQLRNLRSGGPVATALMAVGLAAVALAHYLVYFVNIGAFIGAVGVNSVGVASVLYRDKEWRKESELHFRNELDGIKPTLTNQIVLEAFEGSSLSEVLRVFIESDVVVLQPRDRLARSVVPASDFLREVKAIYQSLEETHQWTRGTRPKIEFRFIESVVGPTYELSPDLLDLEAFIIDNKVLVGLGLNSASAELEVVETSDDLTQKTFGAVRPTTSSEIRTFVVSDLDSPTVSGASLFSGRPTRR